ncbi:hypothetical protein Gohar_000228, partial [Gossypium harknessii]|nr:hypothetical protein [Gossypium harknessii]
MALLLAKIWQQRALPKHLLASTWEDANG